MSLNRIATIVSSLTASLLLIIKLIVGIISGSIAVLSSAIDSLLDLFVSVFNFIAIKNAEKPIDKNFNYGRGKIEALASLFEGLIISASGLYILYESIFKLINKESVSYLGTSIIVMFISFIITLALVTFLNFVANKTNNLVIKSDALHYKTDLLTNGGILLALLIIKFSGFYYIDGIIGIFISIYIIYSAYGLIKDGFLLILDISLDKKTVNKIIDIIKSKRQVSSFHFLRTRKSGNIKFVDVHLVFNENIKLVNAHEISDEIEEDIKKIDQESDWVFNIHLDPFDDSKTQK